MSFNFITAFTTKADKKDLKFMPQSKNLFKFLARLMSASTTVLIFEEFSENQKNLNLLQNIELFDVTLEGFLMTLKYPLRYALIDKYNNHRTRD